MSNSGWTLADHACRHCLGRIIERDRVFRCSVCGATAEGSPRPICGCGITVGGDHAKPAGFRCGPNPKRSPVSPSEVLILFGERPAVVHSAGGGS
jgi:hypothetical protein